MKLDTFLVLAILFSPPSHMQTTPHSYISVPNGQPEWLFMACFS